MKRANLFRCFYGLLVIAMSLASVGCGQDFYLSESEAAIFNGLMSREQDANNFISVSLPGQMLDLQFDNSNQPPTIRSTNLVTLMRNYTTLGLEESSGHVQLDRLNGELQKQIENWIRGELQLYTGNNNAGVRLSQLTSIQVHFLNRPTFTFHPERQAIAFNLSIRLNISGTIEVNVLDAITDFLFDINGSYPLTVDINNFNLSGEASLRQPFADAAEIGLALTPQPGTITVTGSGAPLAVRNGVRNLISKQLSQPLAQSFTQRYDYFSLAGLRLTTGTTQTPSTLQHTYRARPEVAKPMMHFVTRASDGKLYHLRKTEGGAGVIGTVTPFPTLPGRVENEPTLFASAADQLELAATTASNELIYAHWRNEVWGEQATFVPTAPALGYTGKPALVASQPGQVEIIAVGRNGGLWHLRRWNGKWSNPVAVPLSAYGSIAAPPFRDPVAVHSGNKIVVVFVDSQNRLRGIVFDLESGIWGQPAQFTTQEIISFAPAAAASGDGRIDVVYTGASGTPYHRVVSVQAARFLPNVIQNGITMVGSETTIGGRLGATPELVSSGYKQLELLGRGTDNHIYLNHFVGPNSFTGSVDGRLIAQGWQGWVPLSENFPGSVTFGMTAFSAAVSRTGKVAVAAIRQPWLGDSDPQQFLYHNSYDSERFGSQPWKTVHWRGYEKVGSRRFVGQPALAITDRNIALGYVGNGWTLQGGRLPDSNSAAFSGYANTPMSTSAPVDPVIVSSVAGEVDIILVGTDGRMRHVRRSSRATITSSFNFAAPSEQALRVQPSVVGYGNGQLEIVAVAQNSRLYHWRYLNGTWTAATQLSGTVISMPILINAGSGQLLVLAVGGDQALYLWSFANGSWSTHRQVTTGFPLNALLFGPMAASSWGDGSVDLALVNNQTFAVYHGRIGPGYFVSGINFGLTPSRAFTSLGGIVSDTPVLTALSSTRLNILANGTDHSIYSNWSAIDPASPNVPAGQAPPIRWSGYRFIGGTNILTGGVARTGANELTAVGTDRDGRLMLSRYNGAGWLQFQPVIGQPANTWLSPPFYRPPIAAFVN